MPISILMPALSPTMTEGTLAKWLKKEGDAVKSGEAIAEIETDKATMEMEAADDGVLGKILVPAGTSGVKVNAPIALLLEEGEDKSALAKAAAPAAAPQKPAAPKPASFDSRAPHPEPVEGKARAAQDEASKMKAGRVVASPLAKRLAKEANVDLARVAGSGPHGRIVRRDIEAVAAGKLPMLAPAQVPTGVKAPPIDVSMPFTEVPNSTFRKAVARRLSESKRDIPHFYLSIDCELDALLKLRADLNARAPKDGEGAYKLSVNDFVVRATALALRKVPAANATWTDAAIRLYRNVDISVAVATPLGLITPVIRRADAKGLAEISREMKALAEKARAGKLTPAEYEGGGFTISNLGMYGIKSFSAIINPPQSCILAVGAGEQRPVVKNGALAIATVMTCTLSVDHRSVDGAVGAEFLAAFKPMIEDPTTMLL
ncbi:MAG: pyruvate dehydrogenase complex dihydrolipoamide acetyltransferase [Rhodospirillales bacterium]|nr:pyruvate dehydrogenase complex dihydrolipoamide acetyltransferase [Rhodospirillales bacterium]